MKFYTFSPVAAPSFAFVTHHMNLLWTGNCYYYYVFHFVLLRVFINSNDNMTESNLQYSITVFFFNSMCEPRIQHPHRVTCCTKLKRTPTQTDFFAYITAYNPRMFVVYVVLPAPALVASVVYTNNKDEICIWAFFTIRFRFSNVYPARFSPAFYI